MQNVITSVQVHTKSGKGFSDQNKGTEEFLRFANGHVCNEFCSQLKLEPISVDKINEHTVPAQPKLPNGSTIRKTVVAAGTEKVLLNIH